MAFVALKPCCFAGQRFKIGEIVPDELVHPAAVQNVVKMGVIAEQHTQATDDVVESKPSVQVETMTVVIHAKEGDMPLDLTAEGLQAVVDVLTSKPAEAEATIKEMTDGDALILVHVADSRKSVKEAAEARAKAINEESAGDQ